MSQSISPRSGGPQFSPQTEAAPSGGASYFSGRVIPNPEIVPLETPLCDLNIGQTHLFLCRDYNIYGPTEAAVKELVNQINWCANLSDVAEIHMHRLIEHAKSGKYSLFAISKKSIFMPNYTLAYAYHGFADDILKVQLGPQVMHDLHVLGFATRSSEIMRSLVHEPVHGAIQQIRRLVLPHLDFSLEHNFIPDPCCGIRDLTAQDFRAFLKDNAALRTQSLTAVEREIASEILRGPINYVLKPACHDAVTIEEIELSHLRTAFRDIPEAGPLWRAEQHTFFTQWYVAHKETVEKLFPYRCRFYRALPKELGKHFPQHASEITRLFPVLDAPLPIGFQSQAAAPQLGSSTGATVAGHTLVPSLPARPVASGGRALVSAPPAVEAEVLGVGRRLHMVTDLTGRWTVKRPSFAKIPPSGSPPPSGTAPRGFNLNSSGLVILHLGFFMWDWYEASQALPNPNHRVFTSSGFTSALDRGVRGVLRFAILSGIVGPHVAGAMFLAETINSALPSLSPEQREEVQRAIQFQSEAREMAMDLPWWKRAFALESLAEGIDAHHEILARDVRETPSALLLDALTFKSAERAFSAPPAPAEKAKASPAPAEQAPPAPTEQAPPAPTEQAPPAAPDKKVKDKEKAPVSAAERGLFILDRAPEQQSTAQPPAVDWSHARLGAFSLGDGRAALGVSVPTRYGGVNAGVIPRLGTDDVIAIAKGVWAYLSFSRLTMFETETRDGFQLRCYKTKGSNLRSKVKGEPRCKLEVTDPDGKFRKIALGHPSQKDLERRVGEEFAKVQAEYYGKREKKRQEAQSQGESFVDHFKGALDEEDVVKATALSKAFFGKHGDSLHPAFSAQCARALQDKQDQLAARAAAAAFGERSCLEIADRLKALSQKDFLTPQEAYLACELQNLLHTKLLATAEVGVVQSLAGCALPAFVSPLPDLAVIGPHNKGIFLNTAAGKRSEKAGRTYGHSPSEQLKAAQNNIRKINDSYAELKGLVAAGAAKGQISQAADRLLGLLESSGQADGWQKGAPHRYDLRMDPGENFRDSWVMEQGGATMREYALQVKEELGVGKTVLVTPEQAEMYVRSVARDTVAAHRRSYEEYVLPQLRAALTQFADITQRYSTRTAQRVVECLTVAEQALALFSPNAVPAAVAAWSGGVSVAHAWEEVCAGTDLDPVGATPEVCAVERAANVLPLVVRVGGGAIERWVPQWALPTVQWSLSAADTGLNFLSQVFSLSRALEFAKRNPAAAGGFLLSLMSKTVTAPISVWKWLLSPVTPGSLLGSLRMGLTHLGLPAPSVVWPRKS